MSLKHNAESERSSEEYKEKVKGGTACIQFPYVTVLPIFLNMELVQKMESLVRRIVQNYTQVSWECINFLK
jgi:hypothetical protein